MIVPHKKEACTNSALAVFECNGETRDRAVFLAYSSKIHEITALEEQKHRQEEYVSTLDSACTSIALQLGDSAEQSTLLEAVRA